jgi:carboxypeptidase PM20D1
MWKKLFGGLLAVLLVLIAVLAVNTYRYQGQSATTPSADMPRIDGDMIAAQLSQALKFKTISMIGDDTSLVAEFENFVAYLDDSFPNFRAATSKIMIGGHTPLYFWKGADQALKPVLLTAHYDVVPVATAGAGHWEYPPFEGVVAAGSVWGRGTLDDKGALIAMLHAADALVAQGFVPPRTIYFSFGHDEEISGKSGAGGVVEYFQNNNIQLAWSLDEGSMVLRDVIPGLTQDVASINVAEKGCATLDLTAHAEGGHSSLPPRETAVGTLATAVAALQAAPVPGGLTDTSKDFFNGLGPHFPLLQRVLFANQWLFAPLLESELSKSPATDAMLRTTMAPTMLSGSSKENVLPQQAVATVNFRLHPRDTIDGLMAHVHDNLGGTDVTVSLREASMAAASPVSRADNAAYMLLSDTFKQVFGNLIVVPGLTIAATDTRHYLQVADDSYRINPFVLLGEDIPKIHGANERLSIENLQLAVQFYTLLMQNSGP